VARLRHRSCTAPRLVKRLQTSDRSHQDGAVDLQRVEKTTRSSVETPAVHNPSTRTGSFWVEGGFGGPYQFDFAHTYRY